MREVLGVLRMFQVLITVMGTHYNNLSKRVDLFIVKWLISSYCIHNYTINLIF